MTGYRPVWIVDIEMGMEMDRQLFVIGRDIWTSLDRDVVISTASALQELNLFNAPFEEFDIQAAMHGSDYAKFMKVNDADGRYASAQVISPQTIRYKIGYDEKGLIFNYKLKIKDELIDRREVEKIFGKECKSVDHFADLFLSTLIVLLSTKNAEKTTEEIKRHGPKSRKRPREYRYITTIRIGKITETMRSEASGERAPVRAHLRRGHIRNQRIGEGRKDVKQIFIQPVFVNADEGWIEGQRVAYRIKV